MSIPVKRMLRTRGALAAAVTALGVGGAIAIGRVLLALLESWQLSVGPADWYIGFASPGPALLGADPVMLAVLAITPFTVGYFLGLWVIAPITEQLHIGHVLTRAALATGVGATLWFLVVAITGTVVALSAHGVGLPSPDLVPPQLGFALKQALTGLIVLLPLGVLGGVLLWVRRTVKPSEHHIEGLIDV